MCNVPDDIRRIIIECSDEVLPAHKRYMDYRDEWLQLRYWLDSVPTAPDEDQWNIVRPEDT